MDAVGEPVLEVAGAPPPAVAGQPAEHDWVHQEPVDRPIRTAIHHRTNPLPDLSEGSAAAHLSIVS